MARKSAAQAAPQPFLTPAERQAAQDLASQQAVIDSGLAIQFLMRRAREGRGPSVITLLDMLIREDPKESPEQWASWRAFLAAATGQPLSEDELDLYRRCTGRLSPPEEPPREVEMVVGRRGGKSRVAALLAVWKATCFDYTPIMAPGQRPAVMVIAQDKEAAKEIVNYIRGILGLPRFRGMLTRDVTFELTLANGVVIRIRSASFRALRGYTVVAAICDEVAFWRTQDGSRNPDTEVFKSLRPTMATVPGALRVILSSPYARRGVLWETYHDYFGPDKEAAANRARTLVWQAPTLVMHPGDPNLTAEVEAEYLKDPQSAAAEYGAQFRGDMEAYCTVEAMDQAQVSGRVELDPEPGRAYVGFCDPSGGRSDSFALGIAHKDRGAGKVVLDCLREWQPEPGRGIFSPEKAIVEAADVLKKYGLRRVMGDRYAGEIIPERFRAAGITYIPSNRNRSDVYHDFLPILNSGRVELLDHAKMRRQFLALDVITSGNVPKVDHPKGGHDDVCNSAAGACTEADHPGRGRKFTVPDEPKDVDQAYWDELRQVVKKKIEALEKGQQGAGRRSAGGL